MQRNPGGGDPFSWHSRKENIMNKDRIDGSGKQIGGKIKKAAGKVIGDEKLKREGQVDQVDGKVQNTVGGVRDALKPKNS
jgi:uncharacterized protein YjbJ (UPF0337 family)